MDADIEDEWTDEEYIKDDMQVVRIRISNGQHWIQEEHFCNIVELLKLLGKRLWKWFEQHQINEGYHRKY